MCFVLMPIVFIVGILAIAFEDVIRVNKAAIAVGMSVILWMLFIFGGVEIFQSHSGEELEMLQKSIPGFSDLSLFQQFDRYLEFTLVESLGDVSATLFFVLASMAIIEIIDSHGSFDVITSYIKTNNKRKLLWIFSFLTFGLSAVLGNLATVIVVVSLIRRLVPYKTDRLIFSSMIIIAANAGGSWSPIGDVTTLLLWTGGNISVWSQTYHIIIPALVMLIIPLIGSTLMLPKGANVEFREIPEEDYVLSHIDPRLKKSIFIVGILSLALVPFFQVVLNVPPFMGVLLGLAILWFMTDRRYYNRRNKTLQELRMSRVFSRIDVSTVLFFLGILMSVASLKTAGQLGMMSEYLDKTIPRPEFISIILGLCSSFLDNVALVAGTIGMYPIAASGPFMADGSFWTFLAYCAVTGGSILIIGSASGVTVMGMERISFGYYFKRFTPLALLGYAAGAAVYLLIF
ncbi:MAG: sodium:proton antiporter NhaD [Bacteroidales bacterium]